MHLGVLGITWRADLNSLLQNLFRKLLIEISEVLSDPLVFMVQSFDLLILIQHAKDCLGL